MKCLLIFTLHFLICNCFNATYDIRIKGVDNFPHNIDTDFTISFHHPYIKEHNLYAIIILEVFNGSDTDRQRIFLYPGFITKLDRRLKETFFHTMHFESTDFNTKIVVRFYRESQGAKFSIEYSASGAEHIHKQMPTDSMVIYKNIIHLFRPPKINLNIKSDDGHEGGLSINKRGIITCTSIDGFPSYSIEITFQKEISISTITTETAHIKEIEFIAQLKDHLNTVTCKSGGLSKSKQIKVFHHATSVEVIPDKSYLRQKDYLECRSLGNGYPTPSVIWTVVNLNKTSEKYFAISQTDAVSFLVINSNAPNNSRWQFNCSSLNTIPHLDYSGPHKLINITIGENPESAKLASARIWTITMAVVGFLIIFLIVVLCFGSRFHCRSRLRSGKQGPEDDTSLKAIYIHVNQDDRETKETHYKDECVV